MFLPRALLAAVILFAGSTGCGADPSAVESPASPTATSSAAVSSMSPTQSAPPTSTLPPGVDQVLTFTVQGGVVAGPKGRVKVTLGSTLRLVVTSDVTEEVHVHAYDKRVDVPAGGTAQVTFKASIPGVVEVELEKSRTTLVNLQIQ